MPPRAVIESDGERREGDVVGTWICTVARVRYVVLRVPLDVNDTDDLDELQDAMENEEASAPAPKVKKEARDVRADLGEPQDSWSGMVL